MLRVLVILLGLPAPLAAQEALVATRLIRPAQIVLATDLAPGAPVIPGAATDPLQVVGMEARVALYPGRAVLLGDLVPAAVIERNDTVRLLFRQGGLSMQAEGRALGRAAIGGDVSVMNLRSRQVVQGTALFPGVVQVGTAQPFP